MSSHKRAVIVVAVIVAVPVLYALGAGPLVYLRSTGRPLLSDRTFAVIYHPLIRAEARIPPLGCAMHCYISLWERPASQGEQDNADGGDGREQRHHVIE
jgi:hypothetical protein